MATAGVERWRAECAVLLQPLAEGHAARMAQRMQAKARGRLTEPESGSSP
jgi:hypothetical protein